MGYPLKLSLRYLGSKKRQSISVGTMFAVLGVALGVAALLTVMSVTGGFQAQFREKVLGVNAHVLVLKHSTEFRNYRDIMELCRDVPGVVNVAPFSINPMMLSHGEKTATGVLVKGVDPQLSLGVGLPDGVPPVLDLPRHIVKGEAGECPKPTDMACGIRMLTGLRREGAAPPPPKVDSQDDLIVPEPMPVAPTATVSTGLLDNLGPPGGSAAPAGSGYAADFLRQDQQEREAKKAKGEKKAAKPEQPAAAAKDDLVMAEDGPPGDKPKTADADAGTDEVKEQALTPDGGYKSVLPDDDDAALEQLVKDPCEDPEAIKKLPGIIVGVSLAETLELELGTCVTVSSPTIGFQFSGGAIKAPVAKSFRVMAMFEAGFEQYDSKLVYTDLYEAQEFYDDGDTVTGVEMKISEIEDSDKVVSAVRQVLPSGGSLMPQTPEQLQRATLYDLIDYLLASIRGEGYRIMDWKELNRGLFTALLIQQVVMSGVLALIILVAAFTVVATLIMVVLDKKKEISVLKAMGATDSAILRVFLYQGGIIGGLGTSLGLAIGFAVCKSLVVWAFPLDPKVYFISHLPVLMRWQEFAVTGAVAITLCLVATIIPSLYASNIRPAEGFREQ
jgi:lipoprotein-releasing system permease protein